MEDDKEEVNVKHGCLLKDLKSLSKKLSDNPDITYKYQRMVLDKAISVIGEVSKDNKKGYAGVAAILGLKLEEEFNILNSFGELNPYSPARFTETGLISSDGAKLLNILDALIIGEWTIQKFPSWRPKSGEDYFCVAENGTIRKMPFLEKDSEISLFNFGIGNCFKSSDEITPAIISEYQDFFERKTIVSNIRKSIRQAIRKGEKQNG